jgi:hypothetical protein
MTQTVFNNSEWGTIDQFLDEFEQTIADAAVRLNEISDEAATRTPDQSGWSQKQILGHLIDSAANNHQRFVRAHSSNNLVFEGYEQDYWVEVQQYNSEPWQDLIGLWSAYNRHLIHVVSSLPEETLKRVRNEHNLYKISFRPIEKDKPATLEYFVRDYVAHLEHHLVQIFQRQ